MDWLSDWIIQFVSRQNNPVGLAALGLSAMIEYLFPPFPGDTITLFGALLITAYDWSGVSVFAAVMAGSMAGGMAAFYVGSAVQRRREARALAAPAADPDDRRAARRVQRRHMIDKVIARFERHGPAFLVLNRFLPGFRAVFFVAAGMAGMRGRAVFWYGTISAALWNLLIVTAGAAVGANLETLAIWLARYTSAVWTLCAAVAAVLLVRHLWRRRTRPSQE